MIFSFHLSAILDHDLPYTIAEVGARVAESKRGLSFIGDTAGANEEVASLEVASGNVLSLVLLISLQLCYSLCYVCLSTPVRIRLTVTARVFVRVNVRVMEIVSVTVYSYGVFSTPFSLLVRHSTSDPRSQTRSLFSGHSLSTSIDVASI